MLLKNKKGAEMWELMLIILGLVVLVIIILGFWLGTDKIFGALGLLPISKPGAFITGCQGAALAELKYDFCNEFKKVQFENGEKMYVNCLYDLIYTGLSDDADKRVELCGASVTADSTAKAVCLDEIRLSKKIRDKELINGKTCVEWAALDAAVAQAALDAEAP